MRIRAVVPVEVTFDVDHVADLQFFDSLVHVGVIAAEIELNAEIVGLSVLGNPQIQVVGLVLGILVVESRAIVLRFNGNALEGDQFVLMLSQFILAQEVRGVERFSRPGFTLDDLDRRVGDLDFAAPLGLVALYADLGAGNQLLGLFLGAGRGVD